MIKIKEIKIKGIEIVEVDELRQMKEIAKQRGENAVLNLFGTITDAVIKSAKSKAKEKSEAEQKTPETEEKPKTE